MKISRGEAPKQVRAYAGDDGAFLADGAGNLRRWGFNSVGDGGSTRNLETFAFAPVKTRYLRPVGRGATSRDFAGCFNLTEALILVK